MAWCLAFSMGNACGGLQPQTAVLPPPPAASQTLVFGWSEGAAGVIQSLETPRFSLDVSLKGPGRAWVAYFEESPDALGLRAGPVDIPIRLLQPPTELWQAEVSASDLQWRKVETADVPAFLLIEAPTGCPQRWEHRILPNLPGPDALGNITLLGALSPDEVVVSRSGQIFSADRQGHIELLHPLDDGRELGLLSRRLQDQLFAESGEVYRFDPELPSHLQELDRLPRLAAPALEVDGDPHVLLMSMDCPEGVGWYRYQGTPSLLACVDPPFVSPGANVWTAVGPEVFIGTPDGLLRLDVSNPLSADRIEPPGSLELVSLSAVGGHLLVGASLGAYFRWDGGSWETFQVNTGRALFLGRAAPDAARVWAGTDSAQAFWLGSDGTACELQVPRRGFDNSLATSRAVFWEAEPRDGQRSLVVSIPTFR